MTIRDLLLARAEQDTPALLTHDRSWTWRELVADASSRAAAIAGLLDPDRPPHVGLLMDNTAEMLLGLSAAGLGNHVAVGVNSTRRGDALLADLHRADVQVAAHRRDPETSARRARPGGHPGDRHRQRRVRPPRTAAHLRLRPTDDSLFMLIFTSGHERSTQGRADHPREDHRSRVLSLRQARTRARRRALRRDAAVPLQRGHGRLGAGSLQRSDRRPAREVLGVGVPVRRPPVRRDVRVVRRQAADVRPRDTGRRR